MMDKRIGIDKYEEALEFYTKIGEAEKSNGAKISSVVEKLRN
jgi:hypothetical protein